MFFLNKKRFEAEVQKVVTDIQKSSRAYIDDDVNYKKEYREREVVISYDDMWRMYMRNEWVRTCVDKITKSVTKTQIWAEPIDKKNPSPEAQSHADEINKLISDPNTGLESFQDVRKEYMRDILIYDAGAVEIVYDDGGVPAELYSLQGHRMRLNVDDHGNFKDENAAYLLKPKDEYKKALTPFARKEVIYLVANPKSGSVYGLSPLESLYFSILSDMTASKYNSDFFKNNGGASGIIGIEGINYQDLLRVRAYWKKEIEGKPFKQAIINGKASFTPVNPTNRDMQFVEYQKWLLCKIMAVYNMQPVVLGIIDPTTGKLNSGEQLEAYKEEAVKPMLEMECYQYTKVLIQQGFQYDDVEMVADSIDIKDDVQNADIATKLVSSKIMTPNEARKIYFGLDPVEGGEKLLSDIPTNPTTLPEVTSSVTEQPKTQTDEELAVEVGKNFPDDEIYILKSENKVYDTIEKMVVKRGSKWCVVHAHPQKPGSTTDKPPGSVIKCFPTKAQAERMHAAIAISQAREAGKF